MIYAGDSTRGRITTKALGVKGEEMVVIVKMKSRADLLSTAESYSFFCIYCTAKLKGLNGNQTIARKSKTSNLDLFSQAQCGNGCKG